MAVKVSAAIEQPEPPRHTDAGALPYHHKEI